MKPTILLATTSSYYPAARLAMALADAGCTVDAVCPAEHPLRLTKAVGRAHVYRGLAPLRSFANAIAATEPDLIVSGDDLATQHLHALHARERGDARSRSNLNSALCDLIERSLGNPESFSVVSDRGAFMDLARAEGVRTPQTQVIRNLAELKNWIENMGLPAVLKANGTSGGDGVTIARTLHDAEQAFLKLQSPPLLARAVKRALADDDQTLVWPSLRRHRHTVNIQAFIPGQEATSTVFCWRGEVLASSHFAVAQKISAAGHATVLRLIENNENAEMSQTVEAMVRCLGLSGFCGFDFMLEAGTGNAHLIEINPRATQVGHLPLGAGRDLPAALYAAMTGKAEQPAPRVTDNDTVALFPQEWIRDSRSPFLETAYHDVPWQEPDLIRHCVANRAKQSGWYARLGRKQAHAQEKASALISIPGKNPCTGSRTGNVLN
jgi:glutathione synthase/RimK-type ligase-like ATP-grasp enzyme